jgi:hypothetical protein
MKTTRTPYIQFPTKKSAMQTTFLDLIRELGQMTDDDRMVIAAVKRVFNSHSVRFAHSLAPVRLVAARENLKSRARRRGKPPLPACQR